MNNREIVKNRNTLGKNQQKSKLTTYDLFQCYLFSDDSVPSTITSSQILPWGAPKERSRFPSSVNIDTDVRPGEFVMRTLFAEFTIQVSDYITFAVPDVIDSPG